MFIYSIYSFAMLDPFSTLKRTYYTDSTRPCTKADICKYTFGENVFPVGVGQPVRPEYAASMSVWVNKVADENGYLYKLIKDSYPSPNCPTLSDTGGDRSIGVEKMTAPLLLYFLLLAAALVYNWRKAVSTAVEVGATHAGLRSPASRAYPVGSNGESSGELETGGGGGGTGGVMK